MGLVFSSIRTIRIAVATLLELNQTFAAVLRRISSPAPLPSAWPTESAWQARPYPFPVTPLPEIVDVLIIGSGITGASFANTFLSSPNSHGLRMAMVDARAICSGATGRNGGHIKDSPYFDYPRLRAQFGKAVARDIVRFRAAHLDALLQLAESLGPDVVSRSEIRKVLSLDAFFDAPFFAKSAARLRTFLVDHPEEAANYTLIDDVEDARRRFLLPRTVGVITYPAGALSPYNLVTSLLAHLLKTHADFSVHAHTPVVSLTPALGEPGMTLVRTAAGHTIRAKNIVHATNGHISHLVRGLTGKIFPMRAHMSAQAPGSALPLLAHAHSWCFIFQKGFDYLSQRPDGTLMLGGGFTNGEDEGNADIGVAEDDDTSLFVTAHLRGLLPSVFGKHWGTTPAKDVAMWTGILGWSADILPWVGEVGADITGRQGGAREWVSAGYSGEGMPNAFLCGAGLAKMILGEDPGVPAPMLITKERLKQARVEDYVEHYW